MENRIVEIELESCLQCPYFKDLQCSKGASNLLLSNMNFYDDCPLSWREKGYDRVAELEEVIAELRKQLDGDNWTPTKNEAKPKIGQAVVVATLHKPTGDILHTIDTYYGHFYNTENYKPLAWKPAPKPYKPKEIIPNTYKEAVMNRFTRVE